MTDTTPRYYADLNPGHSLWAGSSYTRRWCVWERLTDTDRKPLSAAFYHYNNRRSCERAAERLNEQDRRDADLHGVAS